MPPAGPTHYDVLGVARDAAGDEVRRAYLRRARELHPDSNPSPDPALARAMQDVNEAWRVLRDPVSRAAYDRRLAAPVSVPAGTPRRVDAHPEPPPVRTMAWLVAILAVLLGIFVFTAYAGRDPSDPRRPTARDLVGSCVRIQVGLALEPTPCEGPNDGEVVLVADRASRCPTSATPHAVPGEGLVVCLDRG